MIAAVGRGRLGRRQFKTEKNLLIIKTAHPSLLRSAVKNRPMKGQTSAATVTKVPNGPVANIQKKVFWYNTDLEVEILYENYLELVARTGYKPPRLLVEENIHEIAQRILVRQYILITLVQRRWRGFMARRVVKLYRYEVIRLRQMRSARLLRIQRHYRGHAARMFVAHMITRNKKNFIMTTYRNERRERRAAEERQLTALKVQGYYRRERAEERSARCMSKIDTASSHNNSRQQAFGASCYSDERTAKVVEEIVRLEEQAQKVVNMDIQNQEIRKHFIVQRIREIGPTGYGNRSLRRHMISELQPLPAPATGTEEKTRKVSIITGIKTNKIPRNILHSSNESSRSKGMRKLFESDLQQLMDQAVLRVSKDFKPRNLLSRLKDHNEMHSSSRYRYRFPEGVNENALDWLNEDIDIVVKYQDQGGKL